MTYWLQILRSWRRWTHQKSTQKDSVRKRLYFHKKKEKLFFQSHMDESNLFVKACPMLIARAHMQQSQRLQQQSNSKRVGALSLIPFCLGISGHPSGSRQGHPRYTGARTAGRPWVARTQFSTAVQCRNTANMVAERCRSGAGALAARALLTRVLCYDGSQKRRTH